MCKLKQAFHHQEFGPSLISIVKLLRSQVGGIDNSETKFASTPKLRQCSFAFPTRLFHDIEGCHQVRTEEGGEFFDLIHWWPKLFRYVSIVGSQPFSRGIRATGIMTGLGGQNKPLVDSVFDPQQQLVTSIASCNCSGQSFIVEGLCPRIQNMKSSSNLIRDRVPSRRSSGEHTHILCRGTSPCNPDSPPGIEERWKLLGRNKRPDPFSSILVENNDCTYKPGGF